VTSGTVDIRPAGPPDAGAIAAIYNHGIEERQATFETRLRSSDEILGWLAAGERYPVIVAVYEGAVAGWARIASYSEREAYRGVAECQVYVHPARRRLGVGAALANSIALEAESKGYWKLIGRLFTTNDASVALVDRCEFRHVGVHLRHGRLDGRWKDVLLVERLLGDAA
jgi:L-amino acid N-acyltransferase YncA